MTKSIIRLSLTGMLAGIVASAPVQTSAQDTNTPAAEKQESRPKRTTVPLHGRLKAVDTIARTITVGGHTIQITSETKISKGGQSAVLSDGVIGEEVSVLYRKTEDGRFDATSVRFGPKEHQAQADKKDAEQGN
jgi:ribosomal protein S3